MKKTAILLIFCMLLPFVGCRTTEPAQDHVIDIGATETPEATEAPDNRTEAPAYTHAPAETEYIISFDTPVPTAAPTAAPTATPVPVIPKSVEEAIAQYETEPMGYTPVSRAALHPNYPIEEPRYKLGTDGVYHSSEATDDNEAVLLLVGDLMCQTRQINYGKTSSGYDFNQGFDYVRDIFKEGDLVVGNLENTFCDTSPYMSEKLWVESTPHLNAPHTFIEAVRRAGFDMVVLANNHNVDSGVRGIYETIDRVDQYRLMHTGLFKNAAENRYVIVDVDGINIGFISYSIFFNRKEWHLTDEGFHTLTNPYSKEAVERDTAAARAAGAEFVIIYMHWGIEYTNDPGSVKTMKIKLNFSNKLYTIDVPLDFQYEMAQEIADAGVDYIIGSHTHSLQPYDIVTASDGRRVPCIYSMGNFISHQQREISLDTLILRLTLARDAGGNVVIADEAYIPCLVFEKFNNHTYVPVPVVRPYNNGLSSSAFYPAYVRITGVIGNKLRVLGSVY